MDEQNVGASRGLDVARSCTDDAWCSSRTPPRPGLERLLLDIDPRRVSSLFVADTSRLSRESSKLIAIINRVSRNDGKFKDASALPVDPATIEALQALISEQTVFRRREEIGGETT